MEYLQVGAWALDAVTLVGTGIFFYQFIKRPDKTVALYMISILNLLDLLFPIQSIVTLACESINISLSLWAAIIQFIYGVALYWSTLIAIYFYLLIHQKITLNPYKFMLFGGIICVILAILFALMIGLGVWEASVVYQKAALFQTQLSKFNHGYQIAFFVVYDVIGSILPILITFFCYFSIFKALQKFNKLFGTQSKPYRVFWYCVIQVICFVPGPFAEFYFSWYGDLPPVGLSVATSCLHRLWGVMNLLAYWFLLPTQKSNSLSATTAEMEVATSMSYSGGDLWV